MHAPSCPIADHVVGVLQAEKHLRARGPCKLFPSPLRHQEPLPTNVLHAAVYSRATPSLSETGSAGPLSHLFGLTLVRLHQPLSVCSPGFLLPPPLLPYSPVPLGTSNACAIRIGSLGRPVLLKTLPSTSSRSRLLPHGATLCPLFPAPRSARLCLLWSSTLPY